MTKPSGIQPSIEIRLTSNQIGLCVEARIDNGSWQTVQISPYKVRESHPSVKQYSTCIDPMRDEMEYLESLTAKGIKYKLVR